MKQTTTIITIIFKPTPVVEYTVVYTAVTYSNSGTGHQPCTEQFIPNGKHYYADIKGYVPL